jgi:8-oxo-dGTP pyrophosphatase MutT (NUDIX family)
VERRRDDLRRRLRTCRPHDTTERTFRERMLELVAAPTDPFARGHYGPGHFTASGFVLAPEGDALLMILHGKLGRWLQPGGHVEPGDADVLAAARREVAEEVSLGGLEPAPGFAAPFDLDIHPIPASARAPEHEHFDVRFLFRAPDRTFAAGPEVRDARWIDLGELAAAEHGDSWKRILTKLGHDPM